MRTLMALLKGLDRLAEWIVFEGILHRKGRWVFVVLVGILIASWTFTSNPPAPAAVAPDAPQSVRCDNELLVGRPWIDRRPERPKDPFSLYIFDESQLDSRHRVGVHIQGNLLKHTWEIFGYRVSGSTISFWFPNDDTRANSDFCVSRTNQGRFDLKLQLKADPRHDDRPYVYWGRTDGDLGMAGIEARLHDLIQSAAR